MSPQGSLLLSDPDPGHFLRRGIQVLAQDLPEPVRARLREQARLEGWDLHRQLEEITAESMKTWARERCTRLQSRVEQLSLLEERTSP